MSGKNPVSNYAVEYLQGGPSKDEVATLVGTAIAVAADPTGDPIGDTTDGDLPMIETLPTDITDTSLVYAPDGVGGVQARAEAASGGASMVPYYIAVGDTFTVPLYKQALFSEPIEVDGALIVNGLLLGVD